jgi:hypothetical protein
MELDAVCARFKDLRGDFKSRHRMKYDLNIEGIESSIKNIPRSFSKFANMKRNSSGYPSSMFFESQSAGGLEEVVNWFEEFFHTLKKIM